MRLKGKRALITGGGSGIGEGIALRFAREGADVAVNDLYSEKAKSVAEKVEAEGRRGLSVPADICDGAAVRQMVSQTQDDFGGIDVLVHCAGIAPTVEFHEMTDDAWDRMIQVHLYGLYHAARAVIGQMRSQKSGRIIAISSAAGVTGDPFLVHYSAAKAGIIGFCKALARENAAEGITVNAIAPGLIDTPILEGMDPAVRERYMPPVGRIGLPSDIASTALFLASDESEFMTGQVLSPNGGAVT